MNVPETIKNTVYEIERHCNNYFNGSNDPKDPERDYPDAFIALAEQIAEFKKHLHESQSIRKTLAGASLDGYTETLKYNSWQSAFAPELAIYKRVKSL